MSLFIMITQTSKNKAMPRTQNLAIFAIPTIGKANTLRTNSPSRTHLFEPLVTGTKSVIVSGEMTSRMGATTHGI